MDQIKHKVKAVIFDMDGTIIQTEHIWKQVTVDVLAYNGIHTLDDEATKLLKSFSGMNMTNVVKKLKTHFGLEKTIDELVRYKMALAQSYFQQKVEFIEGFELFHEKIAHHQIPSGIATNATANDLANLAKQMNFEKFFGNNLYCIEHVDNKPKPDPALFLHTAEQLGAKPEECVVFEDSVFGFQAAQAAGMKCIAIKNELNQEHLIHAHDSIENYHQAVDALKKI